MQLVTIGDWPVRDSFRAGEGRYFGIAIGPDSDEAIVRVDGHLLQAGRVLPLRTTDGYAISREIGRIAANSRAGGNPDLDLLAIKSVQLMLFHCADELACEVARPSHERFSDPSTVYSSVSPGGGGVGATQRVLRLPFVGRRQAQVRAHGNRTAGSLVGVWGYKVIGRKWSRSGNILVEDTLRDVAGITTVNDTSYVGGTNEAEDYHELAVDMYAQDGADAATTTMSLSVDVTTIGEIGVR